MVKIIMQLMLFFALVSCKHHEKQNVSAETDKGIDINLAKSVHYPDDQVQYFIPGQNDSIYITYGVYLHDLYSKVQDKFNLKYDEFVEKLLQGSIKTNLRDTVIDWYYYDTAFKVDTTIWREYEEEKIVKLQRKYFITQDNKLFFKEISPNTKKTIAYCFWLEGFKYIYGGILGEEYLMKDGH